MSKMNQAREIALRIIKKRPNEEIYTVASGVSPSRFVHIGNFREIATPYLVAKEIYGYEPPIYSI